MLKVLFLDSLEIKVEFEIQYEFPRNKMDENKDLKLQIGQKL